MSDWWWECQKCYRLWRLPAVEGSSGNLVVCYPPMCQECGLNMKLRSNP